jgi:hypothetical protein
MNDTINTIVDYLMTRHVTDVDKSATKLELRILNESIPWSKKILEICNQEMLAILVDHPEKRRIYLQSDGFTSLSSLLDDDAGADKPVSRDLLKRWALLMVDLIPDPSIPIPDDVNHAFWLMKSAGDADWLILGDRLQKAVSEQWRNALARQSALAELLVIFPAHLQPQIHDRWAKNTQPS